MYVCVAMFNSPASFSFFFLEYHAFLLSFSPFLSSLYPALLHPICPPVCLFVCWRIGTFFKMWALEHRYIHTKTTLVLYNTQDPCNSIFRHTFSCEYFRLSRRQGKGRVRVMMVFARNLVIIAVVHGSADSDN